MTGDTMHSSEVVAVGTNRWATIGLVAVVAAAAGVFVGTRLDSSTTPQPSDPLAAAFECGGTTTLVVDVAGLDDIDYELRAELRPRIMLPLTNDMTEPLVGAHQDHQYLHPDEGRILVAAAVPNNGGAVPYEIVAVGGGVIASGTGPVHPCPGG